MNQTVSRTHAHIAYEPFSGHFRLHDDGSEHGTGIVRAGKTTAVVRSARGVRLHRTMKSYSVKRGCESGCAPYSHYRAHFMNV